MIRDQSQSNSFVDSETRCGTNFVKIVKNKLYIRKKLRRIIYIEYNVHHLAILINKITDIII